jgi:CRISPR-associated protein Cmr3
MSLQYLIQIEPLGMLYGSAGPFLSPENLVGRAGNRFPPSSVTVAGLYAATAWEGEGSLDDLTIVGPFWAETKAPPSFYVPTPLNFRIQTDPDGSNPQIVERWQWNRDDGWHLSGDTKEKKSLNNSWVAIEHWSQLQAEQIDKPIPVIPSNEVWAYHPHLHPRLADDERHVVRPLADDDSDLPAQQGSLFLENGVQIHPDRCLVYLSSRPLSAGWYRFGGEGHLAAVTCIEIPADSTIAKLMRQDLGECFSLLVPGVWGSQRLSYRFPTPNGKDSTPADLYPIPASIQSPTEQQIASFWSIDALMTERPIPFRFRMGGAGKAKRLSRGRYAVPAGTVYQVSAQIPPWQDWQQEWFPIEAYSYKNWGCGFALPLTPPNHH